MWGYCLLGIFVLFLAVVLIRTARFQPKKQNTPPAEAIEFDRQAAIDALAKLIQCKTISYNDPALEDDAEFEMVSNAFSELFDEDEE